jgi:hypothetical protein
VLGREEWNGIIVYNELMQIISNFTFKEQLFQNSIQEGIRYDEISHPETYEYLIALRSLIGPSQSLKSLFPTGFIQKQPVKT